MTIKTCVFPVGGLGSRFLPATKSIPKEMLVVVDKPLIQYAVEEAKAAGIERFIFVTSQGKASIEDHFDRNQFLEQTLESRGKFDSLQMIIDAALEPSQAVYIRQPAPLGLGHAVLCAKHLIQDNAFAVILADDLILSKKSCLKQMIDNYKSSDGNMVASLTVPLEHTSRYGILKPLAGQDLNESKIHSIDVVEKPDSDKAPSQSAIIGRYILRRDIFCVLEQQQPGSGFEIQLTDALQRMLPDTALTGFKYKGERFDCGTKEGWLEANIAFACNDPVIYEAILPVLKRFSTTH
jgi:UTP--glucose-1-phosphate uridylyltransferase